MSIKLSYPRSPDNGQMSDKSLELCPQYPHPYTGDIVTLPSLGAHWQSTDQHNTGIMANSVWSYCHTAANMSSNEWDRKYLCIFSLFVSTSVSFLALFAKSVSKKVSIGTLLCCALSVVTSLWVVIAGQGTGICLILRCQEGQKSISRRQCSA